MSNKKNKIIISMIIMLSICVLGLVTNKTRVEIINSQNNKNILNKTLEVKERLLKEENKKEGYEISGNINIANEQISSELELGLYKDDKKIEITYYENGKYSFKNISKGKYEIKIENNNDYVIKNNVIDVEIIDRNLKVDIELKRLYNFKPKIKKYIKEIRIKNNGKENVYKYNKNNKVNLPIKKLKNLTGEVKYEFEITNTNDKEGYVKVIKDVLPKGLSFNKDKNKEWKIKDGKIYTTCLSNVKFKANETKIVELILDIENTNEAKSYLNKVSITGEVYHVVELVSIKGLYQSLEILDGDTVKEQKIVDDNYVFKGWYRDKSYKKKYDFDEPVTENLRLYAKMNKKLNVKYVIGKELYKEEIVEEGNKTNKPKNPIKEGYTFDKWYKDENLTEEYDFNKEIVEDTIIYGKMLQDKEQKVSVTYYINNEVNGDVEKVDVGSIITERKIDSTNKQVFSGWYADSELKTKFDFTKPISKNTQIYGILINKYNIKYTIIDNNNEEDILNEVRNEGSLIEDIIPNEKESVEEGNKLITYQFDGWYIDKEMTQKYDFINNNKLVKDTQFYGRYIEAKACLTKENIKIPTKEEIIEKVTKEYKPVNLKTDTGEANPSAPIVVDGFQAWYNSSSKSYILMNYVNDTIPDNLYIPDTIDDIPVTGIAYSGFSDKTFKNIIFSKNIESILQGAFTKAKVEKLDFTNSINLKKIGESAFVESNIGTLNLGNSVNLTEIVQNAFSKATIEIVKLGNSISLSELSTGAFTNGHINELYFDNALSLTALPTGVFSGTEIKKLDFGNAINLSSISNDVFTNLNLEELDLSKLFLIEEYSNGLFTNKNNKIKKVIFGPGVKVINEVAFSNLSIENVDFDCASSLQTIKQQAFSDNQIETLKLENLPNYNNFDISIVWRNPIKNVILKDLPKLLDYDTAHGGSSQMYITTQFNFTFDNVGSINLNADTLSNSNVYKLSIKNMENLTSISAIAFGNNQKLTSVELSNLRNLENIGTDDDPAGNAVFQDCHNLSNLSMINLPKLRRINNYAFRKANLETINLDLSNLVEIGHGAFYGNSNLTTLNLNLPNLITIEQYAFYNTNINELIFNSENTPKLESIGNFAFDSDSPSESRLNTIIIKDLPNLNFTSDFNLIFDTVYLKKLELNNLSKLDHLENIILDGREEVSREIIIKDCENLNLNDILLPGCNISNLTLENLPKTTELISGAFSNNNFKNLDLSKLENLQTIKVNAFSNNPNLQNIKLPASLTTIEDGAFGSDNNISCIEILGDKSRFDEKWESIGFPTSISPTTCIFTDNNQEVTISNLLANIFNLDDKNNIKTFDLILYKMDDKSLINDNYKYILKKYDGKDFKDINLSEVIEDYGRYEVTNDKGIDLKPFNNKIYVDNLTEGTYKLVCTNNPKSQLTFVIESNSDITGGAKINNTIRPTNLISEAEAELITSIQTGGVSSKNLLLLLSLILCILYILFIYQKKKI